MNAKFFLAIFFFGLIWIPFAWIWLGPTSTKTKTCRTIILVIGLALFIPLIFMGIAYLALNAVGES